MSSVNGWSLLWNYKKNKFRKLLLLFISNSVFKIICHFTKHYLWSKTHNNIRISKLQPTRCNFSWFFISTDAVHVSGGSTAHHQEHKTVHTIFRYCQPILMLAAIVDEMERSYISSTIAASYVMTDGVNFDWGMELTEWRRDS